MQIKVSLNAPQKQEWASHETEDANLTIQESTMSRVLFPVFCKSDSQQSDLFSPEVHLLEEDSTKLLDATVMFWPATFCIHAVTNGQNGHKMEKSLP